MKRDSLSDYGAAQHIQARNVCSASQLLLLAQGAQAGGGGNNANIQQGLRTKLEQIIQVNQLQQFYPPQALQAVLNRLNSVDFKCAVVDNDRLRSNLSLSLTS